MARSRAETRAALPLMNLPFVFRRPKQLRLSARSACFLTVPASRVTAGGVGSAVQAMRKTQLNLACSAGAPRRVIRGTACVVLTAIGVVAGGCGSSASSPSSGLGLPDLVAKVRSGVIRIEAAACDGTGAIGTGFLVGPRLVVTVEHVVERSSRITLKREGKRVATARVIGSDTARDLALLETSASISGYRFTFAPRAPRLGEEVAALGYPLGLPLTVTRGSVSGMNRTIPIAGVNRRRLVQTDAAVNPGNSGGPLLAIDGGEIVGLVDLGTNQANGIAFAVSSQVAGPLVAAWSSSPQPVSASDCGSSPSPPATAAPPGPPTSTSTRASAASYIDGLDTALTDSARTRSDLGTLIEAVNNQAITLDDARQQIDAVIRQRKALLDAVTSNVPPAPLRPTVLLLRQSLVLALADDSAISDWIEASYAGDTSAANRYWSQQLALSSRTSTAKAAFLIQYNSVRRNLLSLPPIDVSY